MSISGPGFIAANEYLALPGATLAAGSDWMLTDFDGTGIDANYDSASGTLTLSGASSLAAYQTVIRQVGYGSIDDDPTATAATRTISWTLTDLFGSRLTDVPGGNDSDAGLGGRNRDQRRHPSTPNDAPMLGGFGGTASYTDGGSAVDSRCRIRRLRMSDDSNLSQAKVRISSGFTAGDTLAVSAPRRPHSPVRLGPPAN